MMNYEWESGLVTRLNKGRFSRNTQKTRKIKLLRVLCGDLFGGFWQMTVLAECAENAEGFVGCTNNGEGEICCMLNDQL